MTETQRNIENIADMLRRDMNLTVPVTSEKLLEGIQNFGIRTTPVKGFMESSDGMKRYGRLNYEILYNPDWDEKQLTWYLANTLGHIVLDYIPSDMKKDVYTGTFVCLNPDGFPVDASILFGNSELSDEITCCRDGSDIRRFIRRYLIQESNVTYSTDILYDFHNATMAKISKHTLTNDCTSYFVKFDKQEGEHHEN